MYGVSEANSAAQVSIRLYTGRNPSRCRCAVTCSELAPLSRASRESAKPICGLDVHIVMDNYATHKTPRIRAWLARRPHYHVHFTPTSASWINQVERWFC